MSGKWLDGESAKPIHPTASPLLRRHHKGGWCAGTQSEMSPCVTAVTAHRRGRWTDSLVAEDGLHGGRVGAGQRRVRCGFVVGGGCGGAAGLVFAAASRHLTNSFTFQVAELFSTGTAKRAWKMCMPKRRGQRRGRFFV